MDSFQHGMLGFDLRKKINWFIIFNRFTVFTFLYGFYPLGGISLVKNGVEYGVQAS